MPSVLGGVEPALLNPDLPVAPPGGQGTEAGVGPRLAYHLLSPVTRRIYLDWLADGRRTDVSPGLVLLFCFGLERRVLGDADRHAAAVRRELPAITAEVRQLRARYAEGGPALRDALDRLLNLLELLAAARTVPTCPTEFGSMTTMGVRVALARFAAVRAPVPAPWARAWVRHHPSLTRRSVEATCPAEFDRLFALRYRDRHGVGLVPPHDVPGIRLRYQPASPGLAPTLVCREDLPDVLADRRGTRALRALLDDVCAALDPYHRWLARFPQGRDSLAAATLLPPELVDTGHGQLGALRVWGERQLDGRARAVIDAGEFWRFWSTAAPDRMARDEAAALLAVLALLDFGVEPDVRFGAPTLTPGPAVLFRLNRRAFLVRSGVTPRGSNACSPSDRPGPRFYAAATVARCAAAVASAAGPVDPAGSAGAALLATAQDLAAALRLDPGEDLRLAARLGWLLTARVDVEKLGRQTASLTPAERELAGHYLVTVALVADPAAGPATVAILTRMYRILRLEPDLVFHRLHERSTGGAPALIPPVPPAPVPPVIKHSGGSDEAGEADGPVVVRAADTFASGYALPWAHATTPPPTITPAAAITSPGSGVRLDQDAITRKIAESSAAARVLTEIFNSDPPPGSGDLLPNSDEPPGGPDPVNDPDPPAGQVIGLDQAHSALLRALAARPCWTRAEFALLASAHAVLPDGAVDLLNEVAIDVAGAPVIEDAATLAVDHDILLELLELLA